MLQTGRQHWNMDILADFISRLCPRGFIPGVNVNISAMREL